MEKETAMIDIRLVREDFERVRKAIARRNDAEKLELLGQLKKDDERLRELKVEVESLRAKRNSISQEIGRLKKEGKDVSQALKDASDLPKKITAIELEQVTLEDSVKSALMRIPNTPHESVPDGKTEEDNKEIKKAGKPKKQSFEPIAHGELAEERLKLADFRKAGEVAGAGFNYVLGDLAALDRALQQYAIDHLSKKGYTLVEPPLMLHRKAMEGAVSPDAFQDMIYKIEGEDLYLIGTSEHSIAALMEGEVVPEERVPLKFAGVSPCFRKEIGSKNVDTRGFYRMHQFNKVEQFIFCKAKDSWKYHEELLKNTEELWKGLGMPYRVIVLCAGDTGKVAAKTYDLEVWFPRQQKYGEVASCSNCTDYQARRLNVKWGLIGGEKELMHTLNSTAIATSRALVAILENYQNTDGSVTIPKVLQKYMGGKKVIKPVEAKTKPAPKTGKTPSKAKTKKKK